MDDKNTVIIFIDEDTLTEDEFGEEDLYEE